MKDLRLRKLWGILTLFIFVLYNCFFPSDAWTEETASSFPERDLFLSSVFPDHPRISSLENIVTLSSKNCAGSGDESQGSLTCRQNDSQGDSLILTSDYESFGNEFEAQTRVLSRDASGNEKESKTIRHRIRYVTLGKQRRKEAEFFDIVRHPPTAKVTQEIFFYEYHLESQEIKTATWALYNRIGHSSFVSLAYHAFLAYDSDGNPLQGSVDRYKEGRKIEELYRWDRIEEGSASLDSITWNHWKDKVFKAFREGAGFPA